MANYGVLHSVSKFVLTMAMWIGRLEVVTVLALLRSCALALLRSCVRRSGPQHIGLANLINRASKQAQYDSHHHTVLDTSWLTRVVE